MRGEEERRVIYGVIGIQSTFFPSVRSSIFRSRKGIGWKTLRYNAHTAKRRPAFQFQPGQPIN